jgi:hypothetical protein
MHYKSPDNRLHFLDSADYEYLLPSGSVQITDEEAATICAANAPVLTYVQKRVAEYPPMADYIDGIVKGDQAQVDAYVAACLAVKAKYPKP